MRFYFVHHVVCVRWLHLAVLLCGVRHTHAHTHTSPPPPDHNRTLAPPPQKGYNTTAVLVWNAVASGGVVNAAAALDAFPSSYTGAAFVEPLPPAAGFWARDAVCAKRCKLA